MRVLIIEFFLERLHLALRKHIHIHIDAHTIQYKETILRRVNDWKKPHRVTDTHYYISLAPFNVIIRIRVNPAKKQRNQSRRKFQRAAENNSRLLRLHLRCAKLSTRFECSPLVRGFIPPATSPFTTYIYIRVRGTARKKSNVKAEEEGRQVEENRRVHSTRRNKLSLPEESLEESSRPLLANWNKRRDEDEYIRRRCNEVSYFLVPLLNEHGKR